MERRLTEEKITKTILDWLESQGFEIICYDFPQSGTGISLHPNPQIRYTKNKGAIIPDIVAAKGNTVVFFENKDRFVRQDFEKINNLKTGSDYWLSIQRLLNNRKDINIYYGVGLPADDKILKRIDENTSKIDFAVCVNNARVVSLYFGDPSIFS